MIDELFSRDWFIKLTCECKLFYMFLLTKCDKNGFVDKAVNLNVPGIKNPEILFDKFPGNIIIETSTAYFLPYYLISKYGVLFYENVKLTPVMDFLIKEGVNIDLLAVRSTERKKPRSNPKHLIKEMGVGDNTDLVHRAVFWFYRILFPYHKNKRVFVSAVYEKWYENMKIILDTHKRDPDEFKKIIQWAIDNDEITFIQSPEFFAKKAGKNYDMMLAKMEKTEEKKPSFTSKNNEL